MLSHVREQVLDHPVPLGAILVDESVGDADETTRLENRENFPIELALLIVGSDMVERERGDDGVAGRELVLEAATSQFVAPDVIGTSCRGDLEHVGIDIDELDANCRERIEDCGGETSGPGSEVDDKALRWDMAVEPVDDGRKHALVVRDELADCPVVVVGCDAEVTGDTVLVSHRLRIRPRWVHHGGGDFGGTLLGASRGRNESVSAHF